MNRITAIDAQACNITDGEWALLQALRSITFGELVVRKNDGVIVSVAETRTHDPKKFRN
jgi:hypothetical protein